MFQNKTIALLFLLYTLGCIFTPAEQNIVTVSVYYETLCPDCRLFITKQLFPTWQKLQANMTVDLVPFGNAKQTKIKEHWKFECQHGKQECAGNKFQACAIKYLPADKVLLYITCIEAPGQVDTNQVTCGKMLNINYTKILRCAKAYEGSNLLAGYGNRTLALDPKPFGVPWIIINRVHKKEDQTQAESNLLSVVCKYLEGNKPRVCNSTDAIPSISIV